VLLGLLTFLLTTTVAGATGIADARSRPAATPIDPPIFAVAQSQDLQVRSASTGKLVRDLGVQTGAFSLSDDGSAIYYEALGGQLDPFPIDRIATVGGRPRQVASGEDPAISPMAVSWPMPAAMGTPSPSMTSTAAPPGGSTWAPSSAPVPASATHRLRSSGSAATNSW
jgi:hypothetical protein